MAGLAVLLAACGSRTGLYSEETPVDDVSDDGLPGTETPPTPPSARDASRPDTGRDGAPLADGGPSFDAEADAEIDTGTDTGTDAGVDTGIDAGTDALPPIDATPPRDADHTGCADGAATLIYVITQTYELYSFSPSDGVFTAIGNIACPTTGTNASPFSMAVDRQGVAYVVFQDTLRGPDDGRIFRVSTATAACVATNYAPNQHGFRQFGMGFVSTAGGPTESLFVAASTGSTQLGLGKIDLTNFTLDVVGPFTPFISNAELTGTGDGRLFGFYSGSQAGSFIGEIEPTTGHVVAQTHLPNVAMGSGWAFAAWGGDFYLFTAPNGTGSQVTRYRPDDGSTLTIANLPKKIVGAGVSTCAPSE